MTYRAYLVSHGGCIRANNEDNGYLEGQFREDDGVFSWSCAAVAEGNLLAAVFDGMGGEENGEAASRMAAETMAAMAGEETFAAGGGNARRSGGRFSIRTEEFVWRAGERILALAGHSRMGTTYTAVSVEEDTYFFSNLGDSRGYLYRKGCLTQMTKDHNMVRELYRNGVLTKEQADRHPDRHTLYQYLGLRDEEEGMTPEPYLAAPVKAVCGDICLLCSDGLTEMLKEAEIAAVLAAKDSVEEKAQRLLQKALEAGGRDNVTVVVVNCE